MRVTPHRGYKKEESLSLLKSPLNIPPGSILWLLCNDEYDHKEEREGKGEKKREHPSVTITATDVERTIYIENQRRNAGI